MANTITNVMPKLLAQGLLALRQMAIMPRLVNRSYQNMAAQKGDVINVPIPSALPVNDVVPGLNYPANNDSAPANAQIPLDQWKESRFHLTDKDIVQAMQGVIPMQASEAIKVLANTVDSYLLGLYKSIYGYAGTAGTTPFASSVAEFTDARVVLNRQLAPMTDRRVVLDPSAEGNFLKLGVILQADQRGDQGGIIEGQIGRKIGADWFMDQNVPTHTAGTQTGTVTVNGAQAVGAGTTDGGRTGTLSVSAAAGASVAWKKGDVISIAGSTQTYVVNADINIAASATGTASISPALQKATVGGEAITLRASHVVNLAFHRDAIAFATRPLEDVDTEGLGTKVLSAPDPVSGLVLRLEVSRQWKQTTFAYDILYGAAVVRPEFAARIAG